MSNKNIPFQSIDWTKIPKVQHKGETGIVYEQTTEIIADSFRCKNDLVFDKAE